MFFNSMAWWYFHIYGWRDILEIVFFSGVLYGFSLWLKADQQKSLLLYFYSYCTLLTGCYVLSLNTAGTALLAFSPVVLVTFIVLHQETLQKNFISFLSLTPQKSSPQEWIELLVRGCLVSAGNHKAVLCVIEKKDSLATILSSSYPFDTFLTEGLLQLISSSTIFHQEELLWLNDNGKLLGINARWKKTSIESWLTEEVKEQPMWLQDALFFTTKTDALFFRVEPTNRTFTLIAQGKIVEQASAHNALKTIKKYLDSSNPLKKGDVYAHPTQTSAAEQSLS